MPKTSTVILSPTTISITRDPVANNLAEVHQNYLIQSVSGNFNQIPVTAQPEEWGYRYPTMTVLNITLNDGTILSLECQEISNQPTWNGGTLANLQQAIADVQAIIP